MPLATRSGAPPEDPGGLPLRVDGLTKLFAGRFALAPLDLRVAPGEIYGLLGPNGSGKTTTVKLVTGLYRPTAGRVLVAGVDLQREPERAKRLVGYVPDEPHLYERITGREFLDLVGELWAVPAPERGRRIEELATVFHLDDLLDEHVDHYSRGSRQKIALAAALLHAPRLLVIDEPIVGLDPESALRARELLLAFAAAGGGVLLCTHTLGFAESLCARVGLLRDGRLVAEGDLASLRAAAARPAASLEELYLQLAARP